MSLLNGRIKVDCSFVSAGTSRDGKKLIIVRVSVTDTQEGKVATLYAGKSEEDQKRYFEFKGNTHVTPFLGKDAAKASISKIEKRIRDIDDDIVISYLAQV